MYRARKFVDYIEGRETNTDLFDRGEVFAASPS